MPTCSDETLGVADTVGGLLDSKGSSCDVVVFVVGTATNGVAILRRQGKTIKVLGIEEMNIGNEATSKNQNEQTLNLCRNHQDMVL